MRNVHKVLVALAFSDLEHVRVGSAAEKIFRRSPATAISHRDEKVAGRYLRRMGKHA